VLGTFLRQGLLICWPKLASDCDSPDLCFPSS
jgi:hypothetical protein